MNVVILSSRTGRALTRVNELTPVFAAITPRQPPLGVKWYQVPQTKEEWGHLADEFNSSSTVAISIGFMEIIPAVFFYKVPTYNVHPGKLPQFKGKDPHLQAIKAEADWTAVSLHEVTAKIDEGRVITEIPVRIYKYMHTQPDVLEEKLRDVAVYLTTSFIYAR